MSAILLHRPLKPAHLVSSVETASDGNADNESVERPGARPCPSPAEALWRWTSDEGLLDAWAKDASQSRPWVLGLSRETSGSSS